MGLTLSIGMSFYRAVVFATGGSKYLSVSKAESECPVPLSPRCEEQ